MGVTKLPVPPEPAVDGADLADDLAAALFGGAPPGRQVPPPSGLSPAMPAPAPPDRSRAAREAAGAPDYLEDVAGRCRDDGPVLFRDQVVADLMAVLCQSKKRNALLTGPAGCGKTAVVEELARRLDRGGAAVPSALAGAKVWELPLASLVAGTCLAGSLEERLQALVEWAEGQEGAAVVFVDEAHLLATGGPSYEEAAQVLKPALARGRARFVLATTTQEARRIQDDPALSRRLAKVPVDELTPAQTEELVRARIPAVEALHQGDVTVDPAAVPALVRAADAVHAPGLHRPDTALTLLERACADAAVARSLAAGSAGPGAAEAVLSAPTVVGERELARSAEAAACGRARRPAPTEAEVARALAPLVGQDEAVSAVARAVGERSLGLFPAQGPLVILLAGATGCGKTELARLLSRLLTDEEPVTLNMAEYHSDASVNRVIGSPAGYVGHDSAAEMPLDPLEADPHRLVLLDEFEKADRAVQRLFMAGFDTGEMRSAKGRPIDLSRATVVLTTNAGGSVARRSQAGFGDRGQSARAGALERLRGSMDAELLNRVDVVVELRTLDEGDFRRICLDTWARERARIAKERPALALPDEMPPEDLERAVAESWAPGFGARNAVRAVRAAMGRRALELRRADPDA